MNKRLEVHSVHVNTNMDADDLGHRIVSCVEQCSASSDVVNLIKVKVGEPIKAYELEKILSPIKNAFDELELANCVFVPIIKGVIEDVTVDYIKVIEDETN